MGTPPENLETTTPAPAAAPAAAGRASVTPVQIALVVGLLVVLLGLAWFFFLRTPAEDVTAPPATGAAPAVPAPSPEPTADPDDDPPVENFDLFAPRDPFEPLVNPGGAAAGGGDATGGDTTGDGTDGDGTDGDGTDGDGTGTDGTDGDGSSGGENVDGHRVRVIDVYVENGRDRAQIQVDGTVYTVDEGEDFADNFRLVNAEGRCATMLYGDDEFTLCEGEEILK